MRKLEKAIIFAVKAHEGATRKGKGKPYILHPLEVLNIVSGITTDEDVLAAAVLHDTVEDTPVKTEEICREFGPRVAELVEAESENKREDLPAEETWELRKQETIEHLKTADRDIKLICLGDKLSNLRDVAADRKVLGDKIWQRFHQKDPERHAGRDRRRAGIPVSDA